MDTYGDDACVEAYVAALFWSQLLQTCAVPPLSERQVWTFSDLVLRYIAHVVCTDGPHLAGICDEPSIYTGTYACDDDRERFRGPNTVGFWLRIGLGSNMTLQKMSAAVGFDEDLAFPAGVRMCISPGRVDIRISNGHPLQTLYDAIEDH